jgi:chromate reductase, NAD(P)H dehydrogenase (quinone)
MTSKGAVKVKVSVVVGSIRKASVNAQLAAALQGFARPEFAFHRVRIDDLPHYNSDIDNPHPPEVARFRDEVAGADALLFVTPEYNRSIPGVLKNAIDWGSRPHRRGVFVGKPAGVIGATPGQLGTASAQQHLRNILSCLGAATMPQPEAFVQAGPGFFADDGTIANAATREFLAEWVNSYMQWVLRFSA